MAEFKWNELCVADRGQRDRFAHNAPLRVYDTPNRKRIRDTLHAIVTAILINEFMSDLPFHTTIVSASANNEAWDGAKRPWSQIIHYMEPVPLDVAAMLFPHAFNAPDVYSYVTAIVGGWALGWQIAEAVMKDVTIRGEREVLNQIDVHLKGLTLCRLTKFMKNGNSAGFGFVVWNLQPETAKFRIEYERNFWELRDGRIEPIFPLAQAVAQAQPELRLTGRHILRLQKSFQYEPQFCHVVEGIFCETRNQVISTVRSQICKVQLATEYLAANCFGFANVSLCLQPCKKAQVVDLYGYHYDGKPDDTQIHTLYVFRLTLNREHDDSVAAYFCEGQHYLQHPVTKLRKTLAKQNDTEMRKSFNVADATRTRVRFIWVTPHESLSLTRKDHITHTVRNVPRRADPDRSLLDLLKIGNTSPTPLPNPFTTRNIIRPTELDNVVIEEYYWRLSEEVLSENFCTIVDVI